MGCAVSSIGSWLRQLSQLRKACGTGPREGAVLANLRASRQRAFHAHGQHYAKAGAAADHLFVGFGGLFQRILSIIGRTPESALNCIVSSESVAIPEPIPGSTCCHDQLDGCYRDGVRAGADHEQLAVGWRVHSTTADMDLESGAVARITRAPPNFCNSAAGSPAAVST